MCKESQQSIFLNDYNCHRTKKTQKELKGEKQEWLKKKRNKCCPRPVQ